MVRTLATAGVIFATAATLGDPAAAQTAPSAAASPDGEVIVRIVAALDEPRGLCLDIPGHRDRVNTSRLLVVHTCKGDIWNQDERFDAGAMENGELRMPAYDLCVGVASPGAARALSWRPATAPRCGAGLSGPVSFASPPIQHCA